MANIKDKLSNILRVFFNCQIKSDIYSLMSKFIHSNLFEGLAVVI